MEPGNQYYSSSVFHGGLQLPGATRRVVIMLTDDCLQGSGYQCEKRTAFPSPTLSELTPAGLCFANRVVLHLSVYLNCQNMDAAEDAIAFKTQASVTMTESSAHLLQSAEPMGLDVLHSRPLLVRRNVYQPPPKKVSLLQRLPYFVLTHPTTVYAALPLVCAILWVSMLLDFFIWYTVLPRHRGRLPILSYTYAEWPYISCIGGVRLARFQGFCVAVALTNCISFLLDISLTSTIPTGRRWRWAKAIASWISSLFLILLSFYSVEKKGNFHLYFTSVHVFGTGLARAFDGVVQKELLRRSPGNPYITGPNRIKMIAAAVAAPSSVIALAGFYGCRDPLQLINPRSTCHKVVTAAAPSEWILSIAWAVYMVTIAMDLYYVEHVKAEFRVLLRGQAGSIEMMPAESGGRRNSRYSSLSTVEEDDSMYQGSVGSKKALAAAWFRR